MKSPAIISAFPMISIRRLFGSLVGIMLFSSTSFAAGNLESLMNAFVATIAKDNVDLKADIALWRPGQPVPPGHMIGKSVALDYYTFRPKLWSEISDNRKAELLQHPQLKSFIVASRNERIYPVLSTTSPENTLPGWYPVEGEKPKVVEYRVSVSPEEMLKNRPSVIPVVPVDKKQ